MAVRTKRSVSLPPQLAKEIARAAAREKTSFSAWLTRAAERRLKVDVGRRLVEQWERENGPFTAAEIAEADARIDRMHSGTRRRSRKTA